MNPHKKSLWVADSFCPVFIERWYKSAAVSEIVNTAHGSQRERALHPLKNVKWTEKLRLATAFGYWEFSALRLKLKL